MVENTEKQRRGFQAPIEVRCIETGTAYPSITAAARATGISAAVISDAAGGKTRATQNLHWEFVDQVRREKAEKRMEELRNTKQKPSGRAPVEVRCIETGAVYPSIKAAVKEVGGSIAGIYSAANGTGNTSAGFHWEFTDENRRSAAREYAERVTKKDRPRRSVVCLETGIEYPSVTEASKILGVPRATIGACMTGRRKSAGGLHFQYIR